MSPTHHFHRTANAGRRQRADHCGIWAALALVFLGFAAGAQETLPLTAAQTGQAAEWTVFHKKQKVLVYSYAPQQYKPYVKELYTLKGNNLLRDAPFDHLHHHALMYGIKVNGLNFWEEVSGMGVQKPVAVLRQEVSRNAQGQPQAQFSQLIHWVYPQDAFLPDTSAVALLIEQRTLTLTIDEPAQEVALRWNSEFTAGSKTNEVTLTGANYHGLGMRFLQELDPVAAHLNAGGKPDLSGNKQDVTRHPWGSVFFDLPGKPATLALYGHKTNPRGDAFYFTMRTPFAYLSATQGLDKEPLVYKAGEQFSLKYLITVYPEAKTPEAITARGKGWE